VADNIVQRFDFASTTIRNDGLVNATALATAYRNATGKRKDPKHWLVTKEAIDSIAYLERVTGILTSDLVIVEHGVGTWLHPDLAEIFAQWISVEYRFAVVALIRREKDAISKIVAIPNSPSKELVAAREIRELTDLLDDNPRLAQLLTDSIVNRTLEKALPAATLRGVAEIATELGFKVDSSNRVKLGQFIKSLGTFEPIKENRLCNGVIMPINCYHDTPELKRAIADFFG
jgi:hypothetical protein